MAVGGWTSFGAGGFGPSKMFKSLPFRGYKDRDPWVEQFIDAIGDQWDLIYNRFVSAQARANLLDPTYTPTEIPDANFATATQPPIGAVSQDTMLDVLLYIAGVPWPVDTNLTTAQKQALVLAHVAAIKRKGNRQQLLNLASIVADGVAVGWTVPPNNFSIILPDGAPSPGYGPWVQASASLSETSRPWILAAERNTSARIAPAFTQFGVGYSHFVAGYSSAGETYLPVGCRINILSHEHFDTWAAGVPTGWTKVGLGTLTQSTSDSSINWEFTGNAAVLDLSSAVMGTTSGLSQTAANINNQYTHRFQLDYKYTNAQSVAALRVQITDANANGTTYYWNPTTATWSATAYTIAIPISSTRGRYACDVIPQAASNASTLAGTSSLTVNVFAVCDGTSTTKTTYTLYRVGLYEKFSLAIEQAALGERTLWLPLIDAQGWSNGSRTAGGVLLETANAQRTAYKTVAATSTHFPYHAALNGRGFRAHSSWTNLIKGSNSFTTDWSVVNATKTANSQISPTMGETSPTAPLLAANSTNAVIEQSLSFDPSSKSYVGGIWVKKLSADNVFTDVTLTMAADESHSMAYTLKQSQGWQLLTFAATFSAGQISLPVFKIGWGAAASSGQITVADAYLYDVTGKSGVLYPPVVRTPAGSTASSNASVCTAVTAGANVLHPLTQRSLVSVVRGELAVTVVPTFDAGSQPPGVIFDTAQGAAQNRVLLRVTNGVGTPLEIVRWDALGNVWQALLGLTKSATPQTGYMTWLRDTAISIRCIWDENSTMLVAANGAALGTKPNTWAPSDGSCIAIGIGNDYASANQFDGRVTLLEVIQLGAPST